MDNGKENGPYCYYCLGLRGCCRRTVEGPTNREGSRESVSSKGCTAVKPLN